MDIEARMLGLDGYDNQLPRHKAIEAICQKHFPQLKFYPELLPIIEEAYDAGFAAAKLAGERTQGK